MNDIKSKQMFIEMPAEMYNKISDLARKHNITFDECMGFLITSALTDLKNSPFIIVKPIVD